MPGPRSLPLCVILLALLAGPTPGQGHQAKGDQRLARIGPAPAFTLTAQDGRRLSLADCRGKVVAVTFIYASCVDACPLLTAKMAGLQKRLGLDFGPKVFFVSITVDPERDTPAGPPPLRRGSRGQSGGLGVPHRVTRGDPRSRPRVRDLLSEARRAVTWTTLS